ncbi:MAG: 2TM domain-containing protein [Symbiopectobacterium sp.]
MPSPGSHCFLWPLLIWGSFLALNAVKVFWLRDRWQRWELAHVQRVLCVIHNSVVYLNG